MVVDGLWSRLGTLLWIGADLVLGGCSPRLDWRSVALPDTSLFAELPCRPGRFQRDLTVAGTPLKWFMLSCEVDGVTYGVATGDVGDVTQVERVLEALAGGSAAAIRASVGPRAALDLTGVTPFSGNLAARLRGMRPDGQPVEESLRVFGRGTRVFQVSALGATLPDDAVKPFEDGLRFELEKSPRPPN